MSKHRPGRGTPPSLLIGMSSSILFCYCDGSRAPRDGAEMLMTSRDGAVRLMTLCDVRRASQNVNIEGSSCPQIWSDRYCREYFLHYFTL